MVRLTQTQRIAPDGITVRWYPAGEVLDLPRPLADALIRDGLATDADLPAVEEPKATVRPSKKQEYRSQR